MTKNNGLHVLVPVVFFDANSDSEVVACADPLVWADKDSVAGGIGDFMQSGW